MLKSVGSNWALNLAQIAVGLVLPRILTHALGVSSYGLWQILVSVSSFLSIFMLGVPMATVREFAQHIAHGDQDRLIRSIASATGMYLGLGALACVAGLVVYPFFDTGYTHAEGVTDEVASQARAAFVIMVLQLAFGFASQVPGAIMAAHKDFLVRNVIMIGGLALRLGLVVVWLRANASLVVLAWIQAIQMLVEFAISAAVVKAKYPGTRLGLADFDKREVRSIVGFSTYVLLIAVGYKLLFMTSPLILGRFRPPSAVTAFENGKTLVLYLTEFVLAIGAVAMPAAVRLKIEKRETELAAMFLQWSKIAFSIALLCGTYLLVMGTDFLREWIDKADFDAEGAGQVNAILMLSHFVFLPVRGVGLPILMGLGKPERATVAVLASGVLNLVVGLALVKPLGLVGVALGIAVADLAFALYALVLVCRELGVPIPAYARYVGLRALVGSVPVFAFLWALKRWLAPDSFSAVVLCGVASTALFAVVWVGWVYRGDPYVDAAGRIRRLLGLSRKAAS